MNMSNITFGVPRSITLVFKKSSNKNIHDYMRSYELKGFCVEKCLPSVTDGGPTLFHSWANVSC